MRYVFITGFFVLFILHIGFGGIISFPHADIFYPEGYKNIAILVGNIFENIRKQVIELVGNDPGRVHFIIEDKGTISNGIANPIIHKTITLYVWPPENWFYLELPIEDWYRYLIIHEFTHIAHLTLQSKNMTLLSNITGIPLYPNLFSPFIEGITLFSESNFSPESGRLNSPIFSIGLYEHNINNFPELVYVSSDPADDFRRGLLYYNFVGGFYKYLVDQYGLDKVKDFHKKMSGEIPLINETKIFKEIFGKSEKELYYEWYKSLKSNREKLSYGQGELIYYLENGWIKKIESSNEKLIILTEQYGPVSSYNPFVFKNIVEFSENGTEFSKKEVSWIDFKISEKNYYILKKTNRFGKILNQIWKVSSSDFKAKLIAEGYISSFAVAKEKLYISYYNPKTLTTTISGLNIKISKFVRYMAASKDMIALLTSDNRILIYKDTGEFLYEIPDDAMKGAYIKFWNNGIVFTRKDSIYMNAYYYDLKSQKLYKLTEKGLIMDFVIQDNTIFYVSYFDGKGTAVYKTTYNLHKEKYKNNYYVFNNKIFPHKEAQNDFIKHFSIFIQPITWLPIPDIQISDNEKHYGLGWLYVFSDLKMNNILGILPSIKYNYDTQSLSTQIQGFYLMNYEPFAFQAMYNSSNNSGSASLSFSSNILEITPEWTLGIYSSVKTKNSPAEFSFSLGLNFYNITRTFSFGITSTLYPIQKTMFTTNIKLAFNKFSGIKVSLDFHIETFKVYKYDISTVFTLKTESFDWWHFTFKNLGMTFGVNTESAYFHFFQEIYLLKLKFYTKLGIQMYFDNNFNFYFKIDLTPYSITQQLYKF
ncbi:hypothetical protein JYK00_07800 [Thermosipho ferrireducens]|uniref:TreP protein n=1 Tax=Thermosipho ferrireducens TaxID=2571116 RepID=A0ABX7S701_9BACT|nr:hypothetical protein [Thermosipho ferrireducens]QTA37626.1 hypothetical protein JYK00_07800 [Thermosipho ferrireducens]